MKILAIADEPSKALWDFYDPARLEGVDLILSAGDLPANYLSFLVTMAHCPVLYVRGNHDTKYDRKPPEGCECIEDKLYVYEGIRILGLGGSMRYRPGDCQYTEKEMKKRVNRLKLSLWMKGGCDILLTHSPVKDINDGEDICHQGFQVFETVIEKYNPKFMVHGHVHMSYGRNIPRETRYNETTIINAYEKYYFDY